MRKPLRLPLLMVVLSGGLLPINSSAQWPPRPKAIQLPDDSPYRSLMILEWQNAVAEHDPGMLDRAAETISARPIPLMQAVINQVKELAASLVASPARARALGVQYLLGLTDDEVQRGDANRILKRGALLHTDIALLAPDAARVVPMGTAQWLIKDGRLIGENAGPHWEFARLLLDSVKPLPAHDEMVRQWYLATAADMQNRREWGNAREHLSRARKIFPSDAYMLFYSGTLHEFFSGPFAQNSAMVAPPGSRLDIGARDAELARSRGFFREAVAADPDFAEAHLRLGRVAGLLGEHAQAVAELQKAAATLTVPQLQYYAALFLGQEHEMLGNYAAARAQFERAATLYPTAQSPLLSLNHLMRWSESFPNTLAATERVLMLPRRNSQRIDPWWEYDVAQVRNAEELMAGMRRAFGGLPR
jgi:tetratricopeptide (TPR) repeat protein